MKDSTLRSLRKIAKECGFSSKYAGATLLDHLLESGRAAEILMKKGHSISFEKERPFLITGVPLFFHEAILLWLYVTHFHPETRLSSRRELWMELVFLGYPGDNSLCDKTLKRFNHLGYLKFPEVSGGRLFTYTEKAIQLVNNMQKCKGLVNAIKIFTSRQSAKIGRSEVYPGESLPDERSFTSV